MLTAWMVYRREDAKKNEAYIDLYRTEGNIRKIDIEVIYVDDLEIGVSNNTWCVRYQDAPISLPDFVVSRTIYPIINKQLECLGVPVFNNSKVALICNDKALTYQYVAKLGIPMVDTMFYKSQKLFEQLEKTTEKTVFKAVAGHGGSQVYLYDPTSKDLAYQKEAIMRGLDHCDFVKQPLIGTKHQDLRAYVIGDKIAAAVLRTAKEGFKSNYSLGGDVRLYQLSSKEKEHIQQIIDLFDFGLVGIDFIIGDNGELIFNEIEDVVGARMLYQCSNVNLVGNYLDYIKDRLLVDK